MSWMENPKLYKAFVFAGLKGGGGGEGTLSSEQGGSGGVWESPLYERAISFDKLYSVHDSISISSHSFT